MARGEGTFFLGNDVEGAIVFAPPLGSVRMTASDPWAGLPEAFLKVDGTVCAGGGMSENTEHVWDDGVLEYSVKRLPDGQWKDFRVMISPSAQPTATGQTAKCTGRSHTREQV